MSEIIDLKAKRGERERAAPEKSFSEIKRELDEEAGALSVSGCDCYCGDKYIDEYFDWFGKLSKKQKAKILLDQSVEVHDLAKRLMEAAIREEREQAS